jgi:hypothetical protein
MGWPSFRRTLGFGGLLLGTVLHVSALVVEKIVFQFDPHRDYGQGKR